MSIKYPIVLDSTALEEILKSLPIKPVSGTISYVASGITPLTPDDQNISKYLHFCQVNHILPFSKTDFHFDLTHKLFLPSRITFDGLYNHTPEVKQHISEGVISGGKPHQVNIQLNNHKSEEYSIFLNTILPLFAEKYNIHHADLWLKTYYGGPDINYMDSNLIINNQPFKNKIDLHIGHNLSQDQDASAKLISWFTNLQQKYSYTATSLP